MLHRVQFTRPTQINFSSRSHAWVAVIVTCVALCLFTNTATGQDTDVVDPPTAEVDPVPQEKDATPKEDDSELTDQKAAETEGTDKTKAKEKPVVLKDLAVDLRDKKLSFKAPQKWKAKEPKFKNITKHEMMLPKAEGEEKDARLTFSISSGSNEINITRWKTQFKFPNGAAPDKLFAVEKKTVGDYELTFVQIRGTFLEKMGGGGPFAGGKKTPRENYMMKAVIISPKGAAATTPKCFIKLVGSEKALKRHTKAYTAMVKSMKASPIVDQKDKD